MKKAPSKRNQSTLLQTWGLPTKTKAQSGGGGKSVVRSKKSKAIFQRNIKIENGSSEVLTDHNLDLAGVLDDDLDLDGDLDLVNGVGLFNRLEEDDTYLDDNFDLHVDHETIKGFDMHFGSTYIYPTNYPVRDYQFSIVKSALLENTLVVLPTGLGKTFIAAVVIYNFYRWYPQGKLIFMAPTKPLVAQQIEACYNIMGIPQSDTAEMTGTMNPQKRELLWQSKRVFFLTPQVLQNDIGRGTCFAPDVTCLVFDEAHRALGNHAYCQVVREVARYHLDFRILALSATPGDDMMAVQQVIDNLLISHIEIRMEESPDILKYSFERKVQKIVVPLSDEMKKVQAIQLQVMQEVIDRLYAKGAIWQNNAKQITKFALLQAREQWRNSNSSKNAHAAGVIEGEFAISMSLFHAYEVLHLHGLLSFYNFLKGVLTGTKGAANTRKELSRNPKFMEMMEHLYHEIEPDEMNQSINDTILDKKKSDPKTRLLKSIPKPVTGYSSHPKLQKLEEIVLGHFNKFNEKENGSGSKDEEQKKDSRVIIFSQYRDSVQEITAVLSKHEPIIKVMSFIGQGTKESPGGKSCKGLTQKEQLSVIQKFRSGCYNTIVSTSVGEEGLDIGQVDLIICFDAPSSPIRLIQRMGRTGRKKEGNIVILVTEGKEEAAYKKSLNSKKGIHKNLVNAVQRFAFYKESHRMIPRHMNPKCYKMSISVETYQRKESRKSLAKSSEKCNKSRRTSSKSKVSLDGNLVQKSIRFKKDNVYLDENETEYLKTEFIGDSQGCRKCQYNQLLNKHGKFCSHMDFKYPLSLTKWCPWQTKSQGFFSVSHSSRTSKFCMAMNFLEKVKEPTMGVEYENKMKLNLHSDDVSSKENRNVRTSTSNKKMKKDSVGKAWRQNYVENFKSAVDSEDDDFSSFNVVKKDMGGMKDTVDDDELKPCSLETLLVKADSELKDKKKGRIRLTKLPKIPSRELDVPTIEDNQIDFCSQISMDTLYNRIRKRSDPNLRTLHDEINEKITEEDANEIEEVQNPVLDWLRNIQDGSCLPSVINNVEHQDKGLMLPPKMVPNCNQETHKIIDDNDDSFLFCKNEKVFEVHNELEEDGLGGLLPMSSPEKSKIGKDDEVACLLPPSSPKHLISSKPKNVCVVTPRIRDNTPNFVSDTAMNQFNSNVNLKNSIKRKSESKRISLILPSDIPEPPSDFPDTVSDGSLSPDIRSDVSNVRNPDFIFESKTNYTHNIETNTNNAESKHTVNKINEVPECPSDVDDFIFDGEDNNKPPSKSPDSIPKHNKNDHVSEDEDIFSEKPNKKLSFTKICEKWDWKSKDCSEMGEIDDASISPPMTSQYNSKIAKNSINQSPKDLFGGNSNDIERTSKTSNNSVKPTPKGSSKDTEKTSSKKGKEDPVKNILKLSQSNVVRKVSNRTSQRLQRFLYKKDECNKSESSTMNDSVTKEIAVTDKHDNTELNSEKTEDSTPSHKDDCPVEEIISSDDGSPIMKKRNLAVKNKNCIMYSQVTPSNLKEDSDSEDNYEASVNVTEDGPTDDHSEEKVKRKRSRSSGIRERNKIKKKNIFIEDEAEDDCAEETFGDEETQMNAYIKDSFIDDNTQQSPTAFSEHLSNRKRKAKSPVDMNLIYKQSLMSPSNCPLQFNTPAFKKGRNCFKMVNLEENFKNRGMDESSEAEEIMGLVESDEEFVSSEPEDSRFKTSPYDKIKRKHEKVQKLGKKKLFRTSVIEDDDSFEEDKNIDEVCAGRKKKLKRLTVVDSDDNDDDNGNNFETAEAHSTKQLLCKTFTVWDLPEITFSFGICWPDGNHDDSTKKCGKKDPKRKGEVPAEKKVDSLDKPVSVSTEPLIIIDSKCMSNSKIASSLRLKENCKVIVHEKIGCDYVISKRSGLLRKNFHEVTNGANFQKLNETFRSLSELYSKVFVIIEKDRVKANSSKRPGHFSKFYANFLTKLLSANITILYSEDQDESAFLIGKLARSELQKGYAITDGLKPREQQMLKSLLLLPKMTYPVAVELISKCKCLRQLVMCSLENMKNMLHFVPPQQVSEYYFFFQRRFEVTQVGAEKIK